MLYRFKKSNIYKRLLPLTTEWPLQAAKALSWLMYMMLRYLLRYRYKVIMTNLSMAFPFKSGAELRHLARAYYQHMSDLFIEPFLFYVVSPSVRNRLATYTNIELLQQLYKDHKQVVLLASHYGNWEYLINLPQVVGYKVYTAYSPVNNRYVDRFLLKIRSFLGVTLIPRQQFYRRALSLLRQSSALKMIVLIADQRPAPGSGKYHLSFLHQHTTVQTGGERMAMSADAAVVYIESRKTSRFHYSYSFRLINEKATLTEPLDITTRYYDILEQSIMRSPVYWLWSHNRWKTISQA